MILTSLSILVLIFFILLFGVVVLPAFFGSPWHPLLPGTIREILDFADIQPGEKIYDLGSGDGRILIQAARHYDAVGVGLEIDPLKVWIARKWVRWAGVSDHNAEKDNKKNQN